MGDVVADLRVRGLCIASFGLGLRRESLDKFASGAGRLYLTAP